MGGKVVRAQCLLVPSKYTGDTYSVVCGWVLISHAMYSCEFLNATARLEHHDIA